MCSLKLILSIKRNVERVTEKRRESKKEKWEREVKEEEKRGTLTRKGVKEKK